MTQLSQRFVSLVCLLGVGLGGALGCSSDSKGDGADNETEDTTEQPVACATTTAFTLSFSPMYAAFDGVNTYQLPVIANGVSNAGLKWSATPANLVQFVPDDLSGGQMMTMLGAGQATIQAQAGDQCGTAQLTITQTSPTDWQAGSDRYNNNNPIAKIDLSSGVPPLNGPNPLVIPGQPPACTNCHGPSATSEFLKSGIAHTPQQTGGFSDEQLAAVFTQGIIPEGGYYDASVLPKIAWQFFHKWDDIGPDLARGMVAYLRSLPPKPQSGKIDFGGLVSGSGSGGASGAGGAPSGTGGAPGAGGI